MVEKVVPYFRDLLSAYLCVLGVLLGGKQGAKALTAESQRIAEIRRAKLGHYPQETFTYSICANYFYLQVQFYLRCLPPVLYRPRLNPSLARKCCAARSRLN